MPAFQPTVLAAIKMVAKFPRIGHIALVPFKGLPVWGLPFRRGRRIQVVAGHGEPIISTFEKVNRWRIC
jgi:hypothetical protein